MDLRMGLCTGLLLAIAGDLASARELLAGELTVLFAQFTGWLAVEVETLGGLAKRDQVGRASGMAPKKRRQCRFAKHPWCSLGDVGLDAQLQGLGLAAEQCRKMLLQQIGAGGRAHVLGPPLGLGQPGLSRGGANRCGLAGRLCVVRCRLGRATVARC